MQQLLFELFFFGAIAHHKMGEAAALPRNQGAGNFDHGRRVQCEGERSFEGHHRG